MTGAGANATLTRTMRRQAAAAAKAAAKTAAAAGKAKGAPVLSTVGVSQEGGSSGSTDPGIPVLDAGYAVQPALPKGSAKAKKDTKKDKGRSPSSSRQRV